MLIRGRGQVIHRENKDATPQEILKKVHHKKEHKREREIRIEKIIPNPNEITSADKKKGGRME